MRSYDALPDAPIRAPGEVSRAFANAGIASYREAARFVRELPYGRNASRTDPLIVMRERRGTCSTKHALLARLAAELTLPVQLAIGMYEMDERNTPGVGAVLARYGLRAVPEAHCYLVYEGTRVDVTRAIDSPADEMRMLAEEIIAPDQIGEYKIGRHREFMADWIEREMLNYELNRLWSIREECIASLSR
jgi:hypothetical protein